MNNILPPILKYQLQTFSPRHWETEYRNGTQQKISGAIEILKKLPEESHLYHLAQKAIEVLSSPNSTPVQISPSAKRQMTLHEACKSGDLSVVKMLAASGKEINNLINGMAPLHHATIRGDIAMMRLLIEKGADINLPTGMGDTPLLTVCRGCVDEKAGIFLVEQGADVHLRKSDENRALYYAFLSSQYLLADLLIEKGADMEDIFEPSEPFNLLNLKKGISFFKEKNPDYDFPNMFSSDQTRFQITQVEKGSENKVLKILIDEGADIDRCNEDGNTVLHGLRNQGIMEAFINAGANLHIKNKAGKTAFDLEAKKYSDAQGYAASEKASFARLYAFLKKDPSFLDAIKLDEKQLTDLMRLACTDNHKELAFKLLEKGAKIDVLDSDKFTALDRALVKGHFDLIKAIIEQQGRSYKAFIEHKVFAHVFGLKGFSDFGTFKVDHEGFNYLLSARMLALYGGMFLKDNPEMQELFEAFQEAPDNLTLPPEELMKKINAGKMVILFTGWDTHITALIFCDGYVLKCNRGLGSGKEAGVEIFQMENRENLPSILADLQRFSTSAEGKNLFLTQIHDRLKLKKQGTMHLKKQPVGNCGWATAKAVFLGGSYLHYLKQELPEDQALVEGMRLFKAFTPFVREKVFEHCISSTEDLEGF